MELILIPSILFAAMALYHLWYVLHHKPKVVGRIIFTYEGSMYAELDDDKSMDAIHHSDYVTFKVSHK